MGDGELSAVSVLSGAPGAEPANDDIPYTNEERRTTELVIALVGPVGSGVTTSATQIANLLMADYSYTTDIIKVSDIINEKSHLVASPTTDPKDSERIAKLQIAGSKLREKFGDDILADFCIERIHGSREPEEGKRVRRHCTIIDSLKNPREIDRLRAVYGDLFWVLGVFAPEDVRAARLRDVNPINSYIQKISDQDYDEGTDFGQSVKDTMTMADLFVRNDEPNDVNLRSTLSSFLDRIFQISVSTPNSHETAMFAAASAATRSACLSRQVGAVIQNENGEIIGHGANDVPQYMGGAYSADLALSHDHRCYNWGGRLCHNDAEKDAIYAQIERIASNVFSDAPSQQKTDFLKELKGSKIKGLIEFSRAVHAEMAAIVSVARDGKGSVKNATLYTTTFPCHNCARHIVAAGISTVYYIEPYPKSLALKLHSDAIATNETERGKKVLFLQYQGAAPRSFGRMFPQSPTRKSNKRAIVRAKNTAIPIAAPPVDSLVTREEYELARLLKEVGDVKN